MTPALFCTDLHGQRHRYERLMAAISESEPSAVFLGGDLFPHLMSSDPESVTADVFGSLWAGLRDRMGDRYPEVFLILGNDDPHAFLEFIEEGEKDRLWRYAHGRVLEWGAYSILGYSCVPPTPFQLKDWERYDVSRYVDPGCLSPEEGRRTDDLTAREIRHTTIRKELSSIADGVDPDRLICLFHSPPYDCDLDRAALDGRMVDHVPLDVHIGSIAIREFLEAHRPLLSLHGHVHESTRLTGAWKETIGGTTAINGAHDGPELAVVRFDPERPHEATRELV